MFLEKVEKFNSVSLLSEDIINSYFKILTLTKYFHN